MATIVPHALTTLSRIKSRLNIPTTNFDDLLTELINAATDYIESACGGRRFKETPYVYEIYSGGPDRRSYIVLRNYPVTVLASLEFRAGMQSNPNWTAFVLDTFELVEDGKLGLIRVYGGLPRGTNNIRASYTAGYKIDFTQEGTANHTLPFDLSDLCERLTIRFFKKRESHGKEQEHGSDSRVMWRGSMEPEDTATLERYARPYLA